MQKYAPGEGNKVEVHKICTEMHPEFERKTRSWVEQQIAAQLRFFPSLQWSKIEARKICTEKRLEFGVEEKMGVRCGATNCCPVDVLSVSAMEQMT